MKKILLTILITQTIFSAGVFPDVNISNMKKEKTKAEVLLEDLKKDPKKIVEKKQKEIIVKVNRKDLELELKNEEIKTKNTLIEIKTIISNSYINKYTYKETIALLKKIEINTFSKTYLKKIKKIKLKEIKDKLTKKAIEIDKKRNEVILMRDSLIKELLEKEKLAETFIDDVKINIIIDKINEDYPSEYIYLNTGKIIVFFILSLIFILSGWLFNKIIRKSLFYICDIKNSEEDERVELEQDIKIIKFPIFFLFTSVGFQIGFEILNYPNPINEKLELGFIVLNAINIIIIAVRSVDIIFFIGIKKNYIKIKRLELVNLFTRLFKVLIVIIGMFFILTVFGFDTNKLLASLGIGSLAIAFATKDFISRFFSGLKLIMDSNFSAGDWVKINSIEQQGVIVDIGFMNTTIRTFDNALLVVPNSIITNESYINWNRRKIGRKIGMKIGVKYSSKIEDIRQAIIDIKEMLSKNLNISPVSADFSKKRVSSGKLVAVGNELGLKNTLFVNLDSFGDSAIMIDIYAFSKSVDWGNWKETKEEVLYSIMEILEKNNLEFAFPSQSIYIENGIDDKMDMFSNKE